MTAINKRWWIKRVYHQARIMKILEILQWALSSNTKSLCLACKLLGAGSYLSIFSLFFFHFGEDFGVTQVNEQLNWHEYKLSLQESISMANNEAGIKKETKHISCQSTVRVFICYFKQNTQIRAGETDCHL